jgi:hypothetical protein
MDSSLGLSQRLINPPHQPMTAIYDVRASGASVNEIGTGFGDFRVTPKA